MGFEDKKSHTQLLVPVNILASSAKLIMFSHIKTATATVSNIFKVRNNYHLISSEHFPRVLWTER